MRFFIPLFLFAFILLACGPHSHLTRSIASLPAPSVDVSLPFQHELEGKLRSFHYYFMLQMLNEKKPQMAMASRVQFQDLEQELTKLWLSQKSETDKNTFKLSLDRFAKESPLVSYSMKQLLARLENHEGPLFHPGPRDLEREYLRLKGFQDFDVHEKNIEHLSHKLEVTRQGNILKV